MKLTNKQWTTIVAALYLAADQYDKDAKTAENGRMRSQFETQAVNARTVAEIIEQSEIG